MDVARLFRGVLEDVVRVVVVVRERSVFSIIYYITPDNSRGSQKQLL